MGCNSSKPAEMISSEESVQDFLSQNVFFKSLTTTQLSNAAEKFSVKKFKSSDRIISQGAPADALYCVASGAVDFVAEGEDGTVRKIRTMGRNEFFGEFGLIHNTPRTVSVDALTDVVLLFITKDQYAKSSNEQCLKNLQRWVNATASSIIASGLKEIHFLSNIGDKQLALIGRLFKCEVIPAGTVIAKENDVGDRFYILSRGLLVVTTTDELGLYVELTRLRPGATFGELSLLKAQPRNATVTTLEESVLFSLGREEFGYFIKALPKLGEQIQRSVNERATVSLIAEKIPVFKNMSKRKQHLLAEVCTMHRYPKDETILRQGGTDPRKFFIISRGTVDVFVGDDKVRTMGPGSYFGEVGIVSESPHSATVRVSKDDDAYMLECTQQDFKSLFIGEPTVLAEISLRVLGTRSTLEDVLRHHLGREYFSRYIEKEFAKENVDFWAAVERLESIARRRVRKSVLGALSVEAEAISTKKKQMLKSQADDIFKEFISKDSPTPVNLSSGIVETITSKMDKGQYDFKMFSEAKQEIFLLMSKDNFSRFQDSDDFVELMKSIGVYEQR